MELDKTLSRAQNEERKPCTIQISDFGKINDKVSIVT
jgi:hypothetical protein